MVEHQYLLILIVLMIILQFNQCVLLLRLAISSQFKCVVLFFKVVGSVSES